MVAWQTLIFCLAEESSEDGYSSGSDSGLMNHNVYSEMNGDLEVDVGTDDNRKNDNTTLVSNNHFSNNNNSQQHNVDIQRLLIKEVKKPGKSKFSSQNFQVFFNCKTKIGKKITKQ